MPWCNQCDVYLTPNTLNEDGSCPTCNEGVDTADMAKAATPPAKAPWHFWVMVVALVGYLGWRLVEAIAWVANAL